MSRALLFEGGVDRVRFTYKIAYKRTHVAISFVDFITPALSDIRCEC